MPKSRNLKATTNAELLSYIMNVEPILKEEIGLPVQGQDIAPIGRIIVNNERYKNAFINAINVIGLDMIDRNYWEDPWEEFTNNGYLNYGDSAREMIVDIADVFDYNKFVNDPEHFLVNVVPNVLQYIHRLNYQKFYKTTTSDEQMAMAFASEGGILTLIEEIIASLYEGYKYDKYIVNKYMLCRRILDGTVTSVQIENYSSLTPRERVSAIKNVSSLMTFRNPNYNPAGLRIATAFKDQIMIMNTDFESSLTTEVLATSYFRNDAEFKTNLALIDGYGNHDVARLQEVLEDQFVPFTASELEQLDTIPTSIIDREFFQNKTYALDNRIITESEDVMTSATGGIRRTSFFNPETLRNNHWLHYWGIKSTSPFKQAVVFTTDAIGVSEVSVTPSTATIAQGSQIQMSANVVTTGFANKAVVWTIDDDASQGGVSIDQNGLVKVANDATATSATITATSVYDKTKTATATITIVSVNS